MNIPTQEAMYEASVHVGYSRSRRHPSVTSSLFGMKHRMDIINLQATGDQMQSAHDFLKTVLATGKKVLFVGTKPETKRMVEDTANKLDMPYVTKRWVGGTLTNFKQIRSRVDMLNDLQERTEAGTLVYRTKKEHLLLKRKMAKLDLNFGGVQDMKSLPGAVVVIDPKKEHLAVAEARRLALPVIALANTDCDISIIDYPIVGNDANVDSVGLVLNTLTDGVKN
ncbi:30S ribosomal protein S2 [Candidatus Nomurabacteria bacterium]|nr:30S ribosomal protein S2 [Candidatus Nomurabacteria bacterium]